MLKSLRWIMPVLALGLICSLPVTAADAEPAPTPPTPPAGETPPATPTGETAPTAPDATQPHVVTPASGPAATEAARSDAIVETAGVANAGKVSDLYGYSFRLRVSGNGWFGMGFQSQYVSSTSDMRNQGVNPDRIDWVRELDAELDSVAIVPEIELCFGVFQYLRFSWYRFNFSGSNTTSRVYNYGDINYSAGTNWKGKGFVEQFDILYEIALFKNPPTTGRVMNFEWRLGLGAKVVNYKFEIDATGALTRYNATLPNTALAQVTDKDAQTLPIPIASSYVELSAGMAPIKGGWFLDTQWISTPKMVINGDKFIAILTDIKTGIFWYPWNNLRIQGGYRYWRANIGFEENGGQGRNLNGYTNISGAYAGLVLEW